MRKIVLMGAIALLVGSAQAEIIFVLDNGMREGRPGEVLTFTGSVQNLGDDLLSGFGSSYFPGIPPELEFNPLLDFALWQARAGETFTGELFTLAIQPWVRPGFASEHTIWLFAAGNTLPFPDNLIITNPQQIRISVSGVPEPSTGLVVALAIALTGCKQYRKLLRVG